MKLPEYRLRKQITISNGTRFTNQDDKTVMAGTVVQPIWNETLLPSWRRDELKIAKRMHSKPIVMCIIGREWVPVEIENIRKDD